MLGLGIEWMTPDRYLGIHRHGSCGWARAGFPATESPLAMSSPGTVASKAANGCSKGYR